MFLLAIPVFASFGCSFGGKSLEQNRDMVGDFELTGSNVVVMDPGYELDTASISGLGVQYSSVAIGTWKVENNFDESPEFSGPEMVASHSSISSADLGALSWETHEHLIGGDFAMIGIYDLNHFRDESVIPADITWTFDGEPADPEDLWYSMNVELAGGGRGFGAHVVPFGAVLGWDLGAQVSVGRDTSNSIVAIRLRGL